MRFFPATSRPRDPRVGAGLSRRGVKGGSVEGGDLSHVEALVRDALVDERVRHPDGSGAAGSPEPEGDDDLHPRPASGRSGSAEPARPPGLSTLMRALRLLRLIEEVLSMR